MNPKIYWVAFNFVKGIGSVRLSRLLQAFDGDIKAAWEAPYEKLIAARLHPRLVERFLKIRSHLDLERIWENIERKSIQVITWEDENYPSILRQIDQPPPVLFLKGEYLPEDELAVAVVGTRRVSAYGRQVAEELAAFLARNQVTVVSGLARGTDAVAHQAALRAGGRTLAVLGCGVDLVYPPEHAKLAEEITTSGALISDYPPGTPPESSNFPPRNRIISGLALATVVIEAGDTSGALITASFAADQGREVLAVPGNIHSPNSKGVNRLIQNGARPLLNPSDVLEALNIQQVNTRRIARKVLPSDETEAKLLQVMGEDNLTADEISFLSGLPIDKVSACLIMMELKGLVRNNGGTNYRAVREESEPYRRYDE